MHVTDLKFSRTEIIHLFRAWLIISLAFAIVFNSDGVFSNKFIYYFTMSSIIVGTSFLLHELAHKYFAQKYGCFAEFRSDTLMLIVALVTSFMGFLFAAPGAVYIIGTLTKRRNGIISLSGPATNLILAAIFFGLTFVNDNLISEIAKYGLYVNTILAILNLLPFSVFDGKKVWEWSKTAYFTALGLGLVFLMLTFMNLGI